MKKSTTTSVFINLGRSFYAIGIIVFGLQQIIIRDFRPEILSPFPAWAHEYFLFPLVTGIALIICGFVISGLFTKNEETRKKICLYLGLYFMLLTIISHLPYNLMFSPNKAIHLGVWAPMLKELAYCGGAFVIAGSFEITSPIRRHFLPVFLSEKLIPVGRIFFSITMILYGYSHYLYIDYISQMVPKWFGIPVFWTYLAGTALICAGICIILKIYTRTIATLLAIMIFTWFIFLHIPDAVENPYIGHGNEIVSAFDALLFSGVAIVIALTTKNNTLKIQRANILIPS